MQSASVLMDSSMATKMSRGSGGEKAAVGGEQFDSELKQQQKQIAEQGQATSKATSGTATEGSEKGSDDRSQSASGSALQGSGRSHTSNKEHPEAASESVAEGQHSVEVSSTPVEQGIKVKTEEAIALEAVELQEVAVTPVPQVEQKSGPENMKESTPPHLSLVDMELDGGGNKLPLEGEVNSAGSEQQELLQTIGQQGAQDSVTATAATATGLTESSDSPAATGNPEGEIEQIGKMAANMLQQAGDLAKGEDVAKPVSAKGAADDLVEQGLAQTIPEIDESLLVAQQSGAGEIAKEAISSSPLSQGGSHRTVTPNSVAAAVTSAISSQSALAGQAADSGAGNADTMAGRHNQANIAAHAALSEGDAAAVTESADKATAFLATLKSISKGGAMQQVSAQGDLKPQPPQLSQLFSPVPASQAANQAQVVSTATVATASDATPAMMSIATSMRQQGWDRAMGERLVFMARNGIQEAQIQVNPRQLGPIEIKVSVNQEQQANVTFITTTSAARDTVDAALPRLREMFDQAGLNLAESEVSHREQHQSREGDAATDESSSNRLAGNELEDGLDESPAMQVGYVVPSGLDLFA